MDLKIQQLCVELGEQSILHSVDLVANHSELIALLGKSGSGKSTLLKSIAGLVPTKSGKIFLGDKEIGNLRPEQRKTVIVFQDLRLFPHLSVEKNISFSMEIQKKSVQQQKEKVQELLSLVQLDGYEKRRIHEISGGQMQRVALARALASEPDILLLDEPFSSLDERLREDMALLVRKIQQQKQITTILVTHDKSEALKVADKVVLMSGGKILQSDSPFDIFNKPKDIEIAEFFGKVNIIGDKFVRPNRIQLIEGRDYQIREISFLGERVEMVLEKTEKERGNQNYLPIELYISMDSEEFFEKNRAQGDYAGVKIRGDL